MKITPEMIGKKSIGKAGRSLAIDIFGCEWDELPPGGKLECEEIAAKAVTEVLNAMLESGKAEFSRREAGVPSCLIIRLDKEQSDDRH